MSEPTIENLEERLDRLERENRWLKRIGSLMLVGIAGFVMMGQAQCNLGKMWLSKAQKVVEAQEFIVRDAEGKARAKLGEEGLTLTDSNGKDRVQLRFRFNSLASLEFSDTGGLPIVLLSATRASRDAKQFMLEMVEGAGLTLHGTDGSSIGLDAGSPPTKTFPKGNEPSLSVSGKDSKSSAELSPGGLSLLSDGKQRVSLGADIKYTYADTKTGDIVQFSRGNVATLTLSDKEGNIRLALGSTRLRTIKTDAIEQRPESSVVLFDKDGKVIWSAPR